MIRGFESKQHPDAIVELLSDQQYLHPHRAVNDVMQLAVEDLGCCSLAIAHALEWLKLDGNLAIGRLRRCEVLQLARSVERFWRENRTVSEQQS